MCILSRYVLVEMTKVFLTALGGLTLMMIVVGVFREAAAQNLPMMQVARLIPYILPDALRIAVPVTLLLAATSVYGRMSGSNEIVAAKSLGISPVVLLWPTLAAAFLLSLMTVWLNDLAVSWGRSGAQRVVVEALEEIAYSKLKAEHKFSSPTFSINVAGVDGRTLKSPMISLQGTGSSGATFIEADEAELEVDKKQGLLRIVLLNARGDVEGRGTMRSPGRQVLEFDLSAASRKRHADGHPSTLPLRVISSEVTQQKELIEREEGEQAVRAAMQMLTGDFDALTGPQWETRQTARQHNRGRLYRLLTEPHRRWSAGFSCLCFVWVGAPMAIRWSKSDFLTSFFVCFLPILVVYYPALMWAIGGSKEGSLHPGFLWLGNVVLLAWGAWLMRRVMRY